VGAGSDCNFCELNREQALGRLRVEEADFVFWSVNPQVHAFDHASVMETLEAQPDTLGTGRAFAGDRPLVVSPVTLRRRFNAVASGPPRAVPPGQLPSEVDARQLSFFAAAWTLGSLEAWFRAGVESVTYYETTGWRGVMEREAGSPLPEEFPSKAGTVFPLFHVFAALAGCERFAVVTGSEGSPVAALALFGGSDERWLLLGNKTPQDQVVRLLEVPPVCHGRLLHSQAAEDLLLNPAAFRSGGGEPWRVDGQVLTLKLPPYALARLSLSARLGGNATLSPESRC
jgi:hypothetical protein